MHDFLITENDESTAFDNDTAGAEDAVVQALNEGSDINDIEVFLITKTKLQVRVTGVEFWRNGNRIS